ncbi:MAG: translocation/assembly module TamB domain-containing protein [Chitinophagaceae bacterium]|nr:translocation/assembly module TamB domain-containing protein [Chitinophagaceae bacterium]
MLLLLVLAWVSLHIPFVQNWIAHKVAANLSKKLNTRISIDHVDFSLFNKMEIKGLLVEDHRQDTLLYAGMAKVNITDWFFFKDRITLHYIGLNNAVINMNRTDSVWNYQFLVDYFSGPKKNTKGQSNLDLDFKVVQLENVTFMHRDEWVGQDMNFRVRNLDLDADKIDLVNKKIAINRVYINEPVFSLSTYTGKSPFTAPVTSTPLPDDPATALLQWNTAGWAMSAKEIFLKNGAFHNDKETNRLPYTDRFDGQHIAFSAINGNFKNVLLQNDTITTNLQLTAQERSGLKVNSMTALARVSPEIMAFSDLSIETDKSRIGHYFAMRYQDFVGDMNDFLHKVVLETDLSSTTINSDDLAIFAPNLGSWKRIFTIEGSGKGTVDNLTARKLKIRSGNTFVDGDISLRGLPDIRTTFIDFKSNDLQTNYRDLITLFPILRKVTQPNLAKLGNIRFKGSFTGFITDFVAFGNINTSLGSLYADLNMKLPQDRPASYSGKISSGGFNLGQFVNSDKLGLIALNGNVKGSGFSLRELQADFDGKIQQLDFSGYRYQQISAKGTFNKGLFTGLFGINDPNLVIENGNGTLSLAGEKTAFNFDAVLKHAQLRALNLTKDSFTLTGHFNFNFVGDNIDNFLGSARVYDATIYHDSTQLSFDSLSLVSKMDNGNKVLTVMSNELEGELTGQFRILELPDAFRVLLNRYYPSYVSKPGYEVTDQDFSFLVKTRLVDDYVQLFDHELKGFNYSTFSGSLKLAKNELTLNADIPAFEYGNKTFNNIKLESRGNGNMLFADITAGDIAISDSLRFPGTRLQVTSQNDISAIQLKTSAGKTLSEAELNATVKTLTDGVIIHFSPSSFIINDKKWLLEKDGELTIRKNYLDASEVKFVQDNQEIVISTEQDPISKQTNLVARLRNVNINDFTTLFIRNPRLEGIVTGTMKLNDPFGKQLVTFEGTAKDFRFDNKAIGDITLKADLNPSTGMVNFDAKADGRENQFAVSGHYNYKDDSENQMDIDFLSEHFNISLLDAYLGSVFSNIAGDAESTLNIKGGKHKTVVGTVTVSDGSFKVKYTQCKYTFSKETILFNPDEIDLGTIQLKDTLNNAGTGSGKMYHDFFNDFVFDNVHFETSKMLVLNTTKTDNSAFYGKVIGNAKLDINGPLTNLKMNISGKPSSSMADSSHIYLLTGSSREAGSIDYIEFIQFGSKMEDELKSKKGTNILVDMNLTATPACKIDVILDEALGDVIKGRGQGTLNIRAGTQEPLSIRGNYDITDGEYTFNFQTFLKKFFTIKAGRISWNGDPNYASININAEYLAKNVDLSSIASSKGFRQKGDLTILAHLTGILNKPEVNFEFILPAKSELYSDFVARKKLEDFKNDKNEMLKQVASLLLVNSFISDNQKFLTGGSTLSIAANTIGGVVSGWLTGLFNKELERATKGIVSTYLDINSSLDLQNKAALLQANVNAGLKILLNNRLVILIGGNIDYNNPYATIGNKSLVTPDITIEYTLTKDGRWKAVGFNRTSIVATDLTGVQRNRSGVKLTYRKDFDILPKEERKKRKELKKK